MEDFQLRWMDTKDTISENGEEDSLFLLSQGNRYAQGSKTAELKLINSNVNIELFQSFENVDKFQLDKTNTNRPVLKDITTQQKCKPRLPFFGISEECNRDSFILKYLPTEKTKSLSKKNKGVDPTIYKSSDESDKKGSFKTKSIFNIVQERNVDSQTNFHSNIHDSIKVIPPVIPPPPPASLLEMLLNEKENRVFKYLENAEENIFNLIREFVLKL